jgi:hypothetical protein
LTRWRQGSSSERSRRRKRRRRRRKRRKIDKALLILNAVSSSQHLCQ